MKEKTALIAGTSGLIGSELLQILLNSREYGEVISLVRKPQKIHHSKLTEKVVSFDQLNTYDEVFSVDDVYCCLGTTIKKAKSKDAMYKVDVEYPLSIARLSSSKGAKQFLIVSSMNANPDSFIWYSKMKGQLEQEIKAVPFPSISIFRPSLLLGSRKEFRLGEKVGAGMYRAASFLFKGPLRKYRAIHGKTVALAMYETAQIGMDGITVYLSEDIAAKANERFNRI
ncbi:uncharacterized protein YbjT (DUF2867 family) [Peribacillus deserti]|uniref:Uncharacterized protein YbjT (DUF2867 family) n=1 Tax=Peribacillus deserti TaxID=673318 RepID=A0ABS2QD14_9BACI|nr:NAD(P)H-binding protein [Peribacillus deserti]MBM7691042.1 uncharacterized protein YbjT (DUF2867 family) [Peribacillus deserti]